MSCLPTMSHCEIRGVQNIYISNRKDSIWGMKCFKYSELSGARFKLETAIWTLELFQNDQDGTFPI